MNKFYLTYERDGNPTAGSKAPADVEAILYSEQYKPVSIQTIEANKTLSKLKIDFIRKLLISYSNWKKVYKSIPANSTFIVQIPLQTPQMAGRFLEKLKKNKNVNIVAVIHDLETLRKGLNAYKQYKESRSNYVDNVLLKMFDYVICHNDVMKNYLISQGFEAEKLISLEIFDYLTDNQISRPEQEKEMTVAIAGNLTRHKSKYVYELDKLDGDVKFLLHGINFDEEYRPDNISYMGQFKPDELPDKLSGAFGLVWDGDSLDTCSGNTGNYLRYNNPHKLSLYLASGIPVIVWSESAVASFVKNNNVGITVSSLKEINSKLESLSNEDYTNMCRNARIIGNNLRKGTYLRKALQHI